MFGSTVGSFLLVRAWLYCEEDAILNLKCFFKAIVIVVLQMNHKFRFFFFSFSASKVFVVVICYSSCIWRLPLHFCTISTTIDLASPSIISC